MSMKIALLGVGKIARDQHVPMIAASPEWELAATFSREGEVDGVPSYRDFGRLLEERPDIGTVSLCLPPVPRFAYAAQAIRAGRNVMLVSGASATTTARRSGGPPSDSPESSRSDARAASPMATSASSSSSPSA